MTVEYIFETKTEDIIREIIEKLNKAPSKTIREDNRLIIEFPDEKALTIQDHDEIIKIVCAGLPHLKYKEKRVK